MRRRDWLLAATAAMATPGNLRAQQKAMPVVGYLGIGSPETDRTLRLEPFRVKKELRGKVKEAVGFVVDWFEKNPDGLLRFNVVQKAIGIAVAGTFTNDVRRHPDFGEALDNHGITEAWRIGDNRRGFLKPRFFEMF